MSWRDRASGVLRLLLWRVRLNRVQFILGYVATMLVSALPLLVWLALQTPSGNISGAIEHASVGNTVRMIVLMALIVGRAHDVGWLGWPFIALYLLLAIPMLVRFDATSNVFGGALSRAANAIDPEVTDTVILSVTLLFVVALIVLVFLKGQPSDNRYGRAPLPGFWDNFYRRGGG